MPPLPLTQYATKDDLARFGVAAKALRNIPPADQDAALLSSSRLFDSYLKGAKFILPLTAVGGEVVEWVAVVTAWRLLKTRGYNPADPGQETIRQDFEDKIAWAKLVAAGNVVPEITDSSGAEEVVSPGGAPLVTSAKQRGWNKDSTDPSVPDTAFTGGRR